MLINVGTLRLEHTRLDDGANNLPAYTVCCLSMPVCMSVSVSVHPFVCIGQCLSFCRSVCLSVCMFVYISLYRSESSVIRIFSPLVHFVLSTLYSPLRVSLILRVCISVYVCLSACLAMLVCLTTCHPVWLSLLVLLCVFL